jgi:putative CocE/NonD family hydrolase
MNWRQYDLEARNVAAGLVALGARRGDRIAILALNSYRYAILYHAVIRIGGILVPQNTRFSPAEHVYTLNDSEAVILIVDDTFLPMVENIAPQLHTVRQYLYVGNGSASQEMQAYQAVLGGVFSLGTTIFWAVTMALEELRRQLRQGKASMEQMRVLMQMVSDLPSQFEHLPLVDMPLLRDLAPYYFEWLAHQNYDDYWRSIAHKEYYEQMTVPALNIGGWYDLLLGGTLDSYTGMKQHGGSSVARQHQRLLIGPWSHGGITGIFPERDYRLMSSEDAIDLVGIQLRWFDHWLKGVDNGVEQDKPVKLFVMGLDQWREEDD